MSFLLKSPGKHDSCVASGKTISKESWLHPGIAAAKVGRYEACVRIRTLCALITLPHGLMQKINECEVSARSG